MKADNQAVDKPGAIVYEYCVLRYVADIEREEFVNIGLLMMCKRLRWMRCELQIDDQRIKGVFPEADLVRLRTQAGVFTRNDVPAPDLPVEERYRWMAAVKSAIIQTSPSRPGIFPKATALPSAELKNMLEAQFRKLFNRLVATTARIPDI